MRQAILFSLLLSFVPALARADCIVVSVCLAEQAAGEMAEGRASLNWDEIVNAQRRVTQFVRDDVECTQLEILSATENPESPFCDDREVTVSITVQELS